MTHSEPHEDHVMHDNYLFLSTHGEVDFTSTLNKESFFAQTLLEQQ